MNWTTPHPAVAPQLASARPSTVLVSSSRSAASQLSVVPELSLQVVFPKTARDSPSVRSLSPKIFTL